MPAYQTLYDIRTEKPPVQNEVRGGIAGALVGALLLVLVWKRREQAPRLFALAWIIGWSALSFWNGVGISRAHRAASARLSLGDVQTVEGAVSDLVPAPAEGGFETFRVGNHSFALSDGDTSVPGLSRTSSRGGPIRKGAALRIAYRDKSILRVEELVPGSTSPP